MLTLLHMAVVMDHTAAMADQVDRVVALVT
jgi:hypothetical protein